MDRIIKMVPLFLLAGFLLGGCAQAPAEPTPSAVPYNWQDALPAPSSDLGLVKPSDRSSEVESITELFTERIITLPDGTNLQLTFNGVLRVAGSPADQTVYGLQNVEVKEGETLLQTITFDAPYFQLGSEPIWSLSENFSVTVADMNFDEALDWSVENNLISKTIGGLAQFSFHFLWDDTHRCFVPAPTLDSLSDLVFDPATQTITHPYLIYHDTMNLEYAHEDQYRYVNGEVQCVRKSETVLDNEQWTLTTSAAEWDGAVWADLPPVTEPAYRELTRVLELQTGCWVKLTAWGFRVGAQPHEDDYRNGWLKRIDLYADNPETTSAPPVQTILIEPPYVKIGLADSPDFDVAFTDYNFDGYPDLRHRCGVTVCAYLYTFYLWDPQSGRFVENEMLGEFIGELTADAEAKEIEYNGNIGCYIGVVKTALRWQGDDLIPIREDYYEEEYLPDAEASKYERRRVRHTKSVYQNGEWVLVLEEFLPDWNF